MAAWVPYGPMGTYWKPMASWKPMEASKHWKQGELPKHSEAAYRLCGKLMEIVDRMLIVVDVSIISAGTSTRESRTKNEHPERSAAQ